MKKILLYLILFYSFTAIAQTTSKELNNALEGLNDKLNQMSVEDLQTFFKSQSGSKDKEIKAVSGAIGFFMNGDIIRDFCMQTELIPDKYINLRNSYRTNIDLDEDFIEILTRKKGLSRDQAIFVLKGVKATFSQQLGRTLENEYLLIHQQDSSFTKTDYCKIYDDHAVEIISDALNVARNKLSDKYQKYFRE